MVERVGVKGEMGRWVDGLKVQRFEIADDARVERQGTQARILALPPQLIIYMRRISASHGTPSRQPSFFAHPRLFLPSHS